MNFKQAIQELLSHKTIRIKTWKEGYYWYVNDKGFVVDSSGNRPVIHVDFLLEMNKWEVISNINTTLENKLSEENKELKKELQKMEEKRDYWRKRLNEEMTKRLREGLK